jgi:hypothetical protein
LLIAGAAAACGPNEPPPAPLVPHVRTLFVPYPRHRDVTPALSARCERSVVLGTEEAERLGEVLSGLLAA